MTDLPASTAPAAAHFPLVKGRCPACNGSSLFLGADGHVTCSRLDCPDPTKADDMLHNGHTPAAELARLHEGEQTLDGHDPAVVPTDGQWLYRFLRATPTERLEVIGALREHAARGSDCFLMGHRQQLEDDHRGRTALAKVRDSCVRLLDHGFDSLSARWVLDVIDGGADESVRTTPKNPTTSNNTKEN